MVGEECNRKHLRKVKTSRGEEPGDGQVTTVGTTNCFGLFEEMTKMLKSGNRRAPGPEGPIDEELLYEKCPAHSEGLSSCSLLLHLLN